MHFEGGLVGIFFIIFYSQTVVFIFLCSPFLLIVCNIDEPLSSSNPCACNIKRSIIVGNATRPRSYKDTVRNKCT
jgi:hypothetical protein